MVEVKVESKDFDLVLWAENVVVDHKERKCYLYGTGDVLLNKIPFSDISYMRTVGGTK